MNLDPYVDMIMCGDDPEGKPKPNPHNALHICKKLGVSPSETIMVGDTPADTLMGQQGMYYISMGRFLISFYFYNPFQNSKN